MKPFVIVSLVITLGCRQSIEEQRPAIIGQHDHDRIEWQFATGKDRSTIPQLVIRCASGIGQLGLIRPAAGWPEEWTIRVHLAGLEGFWLSANQTKYHLEVTSSQQQLLDPPAENPLSLISVPDPEHPENGFVVRVKRNQRVEEASKLTLRWVDFYR